MIYPYKCPDCRKYVEEIRPASEAGALMLCPDCGQVMCRVYTPVACRPNGIRRTPPGQVELGNDPSRGHTSNRVADYDIPRDAIEAMPELSRLGA